MAWSTLSEIVRQILPGIQVFDIFRLHHLEVTGLRQASVGGCKPALDTSVRQRRLVLSGEMHGF